MAGLRGSSGDCVPDSFSWKVGAVSSAWSEGDCTQWESLAGEQVDKKDMVGVKYRTLGY